jgi:hypothetical protein
MSRRSKNISWLDVAQVFVSAARILNSLANYSWSLTHPMSIQQTQQ